MKVRIIQAGFETYTGPLSTVDFEDGVSVRALLPREIDQITAVMSVRGIDDAGELTEIGAAVRAEAFKLVTADQYVPLARATEDDLNPKPLPKFHSEEDLRVIADGSGVRGLREIGTPLGVKGRSIDELIKEILAAEYKLKAQHGLVPEFVEPAVEQNPWTDEQHAFVEALIEEGALVVDEDGDLRPTLDSYVRNDADVLAEAKEIVKADIEATANGETVTTREADEVVVPNEPDTAGDAGEDEAPAA